MKTSRHRVLAAALICLPALGPAACGEQGQPPQTTREVFVSPSGSDESDGSEGRPFATLARARRAVREIIKRGLPAGGVAVHLRGGVYSLNEPFVLTADDSGTKDAPITYCAAEGEEARIVGGIVLQPSIFKPVADKDGLARLGEAAAGTLVADLKPLAIKLEPWPDSTRYGAPGAMELFFNGRRMPVARWPNESWATTGKVLERPSRRKVKPRRGGTFICTDERLRRWKVPEGLWVSGYLGNQWFDEAIRVKSIDAGTGAIALAQPNMFGLGVNRRFRVVNLLEELDSPGEWYLDVKRGLLYFRPPADEKMDGALIVLSTVSQPLIQLKGASYVRLERLTVEATRGSAIRIDGGAGCRIERCLIRNAGGRGVEIASGSGHGVVACEIAHTGTGGILLAGGDRKTLTAAGNFATDNRIHHFSRLQRSWAPGIMINGVGNRAAHNLMHDAPHEAIHFRGNEHLIEFNEIRDVCQETNDVGAIYSGRDWAVWGNVIRYNFIHHVRGMGGVAAQGIYLDDGASGIKVYGNVLYKVHRAMLVGGGRDNLIENNLAIDCTESLWFDSRGLGKQKHCVVAGGPWYENLMAVPYDKPPWSTKYPRLAEILDDNPGAPKGNVIRHNVFKSSRQMFLTDAARHFSKVENNLMTDEPLGLYDEAKLDLRLREDSIVFKKLPAFEPMPLENVGPRSPAGPVDD